MNKPLTSLLLTGLTLAGLRPALAQKASAKTRAIKQTIDTRRKEKCK